MRPQADRISLGISWSELQKLRPNAFLDSPGAAEYVGDRRENSYWFVQGSPTSGDVQRLPVPSSRLAAVVMDETVPMPDTVAYQLVVCGVREQWERMVGSPSVVLKRDIQLSVGDPVRKEILFWQAGGIVLVLEYDEDFTASLTADRVVRAIVIDQRVRLDKVTSYAVPVEARPLVQRATSDRWCAKTRAGA